MEANNKPKRHLEKEYMEVRARGHWSHQRAFLSSKIKSGPLKRRGIKRGG